MIDTSEIESGLKQIIAEEWTKQGHRLSGKFEEGIRTESKQEGNDTIITLYDTTGYGKIVNEGITPDRIPFSPRSGARTSKYITGLFNYAKARMGASDKDALSIAFAIAYRQKQEGMSTVNSRKYSSTGKRQHFVEESEQQITELVTEVLNKQLELIAV